MTPVDSSTPTASVDSLPKFDWTEMPFPLDRSAGWAQLRDLGPVVMHDGWHFLTRREDVLFALRNPDVFSSQKVYANLGSPLPLIPLGIDPPEHTRYRHLLQPFFSPKALASLMPSLRTQMGDIVDDILSKPTRECEVISEIAVPYPSQAFLTMFGLPVEDRDRLIGWKDASIAASAAHDLAEADMAPLMEFMGYLHEAIARKREQPEDDLLSKLLGGEDPLDDTEALGLSFLFVLAGLDTVTSAIGSTFLLLAQNPEVRKCLIEDPEQIRVFIEEVVRLEPPAPLIQRVTTQEVTIGGVTLPPDAGVRLCLGALGRDDTDAISTDNIVMDQKVHPHWSYGGGPHRCLGSHLARIELGLVVNQWLQRVPDFSIKPDVRPQLVWPSNTFMLQSLPLVW
jgi:cytochrome P450